MAFNYKQYNYVILCEDRTHAEFIRGFLDNAGVKLNARGKVITEIYPNNGKGSGKKSVKDKYTDNLATLKRKNSRAKTILVVIQDLDTQEYEDVYREYSKDAPNECFILLPKRNIETWFYFCEYGSVDEDTNRKNDYKNRDRRKPMYFGRNMFDFINANKKVNDLPNSLKRSIENISSKKALL